MDRTNRPFEGAAPPPAGGYSEGSSYSQPSRGLEAESVGELIGGIVRDMQDLVRGEVLLAKTELQESAASAGRGVAMLLAGAFLGTVALFFLLLAVVEILDEWMPRWAAAGVVGLAVLVIAVILALIGKNQLSAASLRPEETMDSLQEDKEWAQEQIRSVKS